MSPANIMQAIEECCLGTIGATEVVASGALLRGAYDSQTPEARAAANQRNARVEVMWKGQEDTGLFQRYSSRSHIRVYLLIRLTFATTFELSDDNRKATRAAAALLVEQVRAALTRPGNLLTTSTSAATEIVDGCLIKAVAKCTKEDWREGNTLEHEITAQALIASTRP